jgi:hypothetical protein
MDQPTAELALKEMEVLVGEWSQSATPAGGEPWPGAAKATFEWLEGRPATTDRQRRQLGPHPRGPSIRVLFRFYGPTPSLFDKSSHIPDPKRKARRTWTAAAAQAPRT